MSAAILAALLALPHSAAAQGLFGPAPAPQPQPQPQPWGTPPPPPSPSPFGAPVTPPPPPPAPPPPATPAGPASLNLNSDPTEATIFIDGSPMGKTPQHKLSIDPGEHVLRLAKDGYVDAETTITLSAGETRNIKMTLEELPETREKRLRHQSAMDRYEAQMEEYREVSGPKKIWGFSLLGAGVACGVTATVLYVVGVSTANDNYDLYVATINQDKMNDYWSEVKYGEKLTTVGHVMVSASGALIAGSLFFFLTIPSKPVEPKFSAHLIPTPSIMNGMPAVTWQGAF
ncbi:MAG: PEGA domain-containing protein [Deltaproteobacteria bacterium]|nr:PEGA domain-containing protein [Deltaproteobacteria bacterium]